MKIFAWIGIIFVIWLVWTHTPLGNAFTGPQGRYENWMETVDFSGGKVTISGFGSGHTYSYQIDGNVIKLENGASFRWDRAQNAIIDGIYTLSKAK